MKILAVLLLSLALAACGKKKEEAPAPKEELPQAPKVVKVLHCEIDMNTPDDFLYNVARYQFIQSWEIDENGDVVGVDNFEKSRYWLRWEENGDSYSLNRESLDLIFWNKSMQNDKDLPVAYYGNSRAPGADYNCRFLDRKI